MTSDRIRAKIEKLRKLGEHPSSDPNEAAAALALAQRLMDEHGISEAVLGVDDSDDEQGTETFLGHSQPWKGALLYAIAKANGCASLRSPGEKWAKVWGRKADVQTVSYLFLFCVREIERLTQRNAMGRGRGYVTSYRMGATSAVIKAIREESQRVRASARAQYASDSRALVAIDQWERRVVDAERARAAMHPHVRHGSSSGGSSRDGFSAGHSDGAGVYGARGAKGIGGGAPRLGSGI